MESEKVKTIEWGKHRLGETEVMRRLCGRLLLAVSRTADEVMLTSRTLGEDENPQETDSNSQKWTRWAIGASTASLELVPALPDLPVLVNPETPFHVLAGAEARLFVRVPISVVVRVPDELDQVLAELPTEDLSKTWFGETDNGELCYWLAAEVHREAIPDMDEAGALASISIHNDSVETLQVERICLRVAGLSLYDCGGILRTNETVVRYQGGVTPSKVSIKSRAPQGSTSPRLVAGPREAGPHTVVGRTFRSLRKWTNELFDFD